MEEKTTANKRYSKCGFLSCAQETPACSRQGFVIRFAPETASLSSLSCVIVETFEFSTYISTGRQLSNNLFPHLP